MVWMNSFIGFRKTSIHALTWTWPWPLATSLSRSHTAYCLPRADDAMKMFVGIRRPPPRKVGRYRRRAEPPAWSDREDRGVTEVWGLEFREVAGDFAKGRQHAHGQRLF